MLMSRKKTTYCSTGKAPNTDLCCRLTNTKRLLLRVISVLTVVFSFCPTPAALPNSPLRQGVGFVVSFRLVLYHLAQMDQYFDIKGDPLFWKEKLIFWLKLWLKLLHQDMETGVKNNTTFNLSFLVLQWRTSQHNSIHISSTQQS